MNECTYFKYSVANVAGGDLPTSGNRHWRKGLVESSLTSTAVQIHRVL